MAGAGGDWIWSRRRAGQVLRTLALEGTDLDLFGVLNDRTADGRDVSPGADADWEIVAPDARLTCSGTRAAELALRLKYAGVDLRAPGRRRPRARPRPRAGVRRRPALRAAHLHRAARAQGRAQPSRPRGVLAVNAKVMWHDVECGSYVADLPLWRRLAAEAGGPVLDVGAGTGRVALDLARAQATRSPLSTSTPTCSLNSTTARTACRCERSSPTPAGFSLDRGSSRLVPRADADRIQLLPGEAGRGFRSPPRGRRTSRRRRARRARARRPCRTRAVRRRVDRARRGAR